MPTQFEMRQRFSKEATLGTGDASKELMAAVATYTYVVTRLVLTGLVAAAQAIYVGDTDGTNKIISLAVSYPVHSQARVDLLEGLKMKKGQALIIKPAAAGPSVHVVIEGYILAD